MADDNNSGGGGSDDDAAFDAAFAAGSKSDRIRVKMADRLTPYLMALYDGMETYKNDRSKNIEIHKTSDQIKNVTFVAPGKNGSTGTFRPHYYKTIASDKKGNDEEIRAFNATHLIPSTFSIAGIPFEYGGMSFAQGVPDTTPPAIVLVPRKDLNIVHLSNMDMKRFYKINGIDDVPSMDYPNGVRLPMCDMRYIVAQAKKEAKKEVDKEIKLEAAGIGGGGGRPASSSSTPVRAGGSVKANPVLNATIATCWKRQSAALDYLTSCDDEDAHPADQLPPLISSANTAGLAVVKSLLGTAYKPLTLSDHERWNFYPSDFAIERTELAQVAERLLNAEETPLPAMLPTLPFIQALFLGVGHGADLPFWNHVRRERPSGLFSSDLVEGLVKTTETDTLGAHEMHELADCMQYSRCILKQLAHLESRLLATMRPLAAVVRLVKALGSCELVQVKTEGQEKLPVCALTGRIIGDQAWCIQCPLNPIVLGGEQTYVVFFVSYFLLTSQTKMLHGATLVRRGHALPADDDAAAPAIDTMDVEEAPADAGGDDGMDVDTGGGGDGMDVWQPPELEAPPPAEQVWMLSSCCWMHTQSLSSCRLP